MRTPAVLALTLAVASGALAPTASGASSEPRPDGVDAAAPIDLREASLTPRGDRLEWSVLLARALRPGAVSQGAAGQLCLLLGAPAPAAPAQRVCVVGDDPRRLRLHRTRVRPDGSVDGPGSLAGEVVGGTTRRLRVRFPLAAVGLAGRRLGWRTFARSSDLTGCVVPTSSCTDDVVPDAGPATLEVRRAPPRGCVAREPSQVSRFSASGRRVALTFDDGPSSHTAQVLRILAREGVPGTFFVTGSQAAARGPLLRRMLREGHVLGNHTRWHVDVGHGGAVAEITAAQRAIRRASGYTPCLFRPPYGSTSGALVAEVRALRLTAVLWDVDPEDWRTPGSRAIVSRVLARARAGSIVLMHDGGGPRAQTVSALPAIIRGLRRRGLHFVTLPEALGLRSLPRRPEVQR